MTVFSGVSSYARTFEVSSSETHAVAMFTANAGRGYTISFLSSYGHTTTIDYCKENKILEHISKEIGFIGGHFVYWILGEYPYSSLNQV